MSTPTAPPGPVLTPEIMLRGAGISSFSISIVDEFVQRRITPRNCLISFVSFCEKSFHVLPFIREDMIILKTSEVNIFFRSFRVDHGSSNHRSMSSAFAR